jgi:hypothetical protein
MLTLGIIKNQGYTNITPEQMEAFKKILYSLNVSNVIHYGETSIDYVCHHILLQNKIIPKIFLLRDDKPIIETCYIKDIYEFESPQKRDDKFMSEINIVVSFVDRLSKKTIKNSITIDKNGQTIIC